LGDETGGDGAKADQDDGVEQAKRIFVEEADQVGGVHDVLLLCSAMMKEGFLPSAGVAQRRSGEVVDRPASFIDQITYRLSRLTFRNAA
jgi:hypothetical protein